MSFRLASDQVLLVVGTPHDAVRAISLLTAAPQCATAGAEYFDIAAQDREEDQCTAASAAADSATTCPQSDAASRARVAVDVAPGVAFSAIGPFGIQEFTPAACDSSFRGEAKAPLVAPGRDEPDVETPAAFALVQRGNSATIE